MTPFVMYIGASLVVFGVLWLVVEFLWPMVSKGSRREENKKETDKSSPYRPIPTADKKVQMKITSKKGPRESQPSGTSSDHEAIGEALVRIMERNTWLAQQKISEDIGETNDSSYVSVFESVGTMTLESDVISTVSDFTSSIGDSDAGSYSGTSSSYDSGSDSGSSWSDSSSSYDSGGSSSDW